MEESFLSAELLRHFHVLLLLGIWWSFFSRWLTDPAHGLGMTSAEQGQIYSINSLATLVIMFVYGAIQDQLGIKRKLVIFISAVAACVGRSSSSCTSRC